MRRAHLAVRLLCGIPCLLILAVVARGQDSEDEKHKKLFDDSLARAKRIEVSVGEKGRKPKLVAEPLLKYTDPPRSFEMGTLWAWHDDGRPVVLGKVEALRLGGVLRWMYCFTSATTESVAGKWPMGQQFKSSRPGVTWVDLKGPAPHDKPAEQARQLKALFKRFSATTYDEIDQSYHLRPLAKPLHEYASPKYGVAQGALCGFVANGTNPDVTVLIEAFRPADKPDAPLAWRYAVVGMTAFRVEVKLDDKEVFARPFTTGGADHGSWTHFLEN